MGGSETARGPGRSLRRVVRWLWRWRWCFPILLVGGIIASGLYQPPIDVEADLTVSRVEFVVADTTAYTILPDVPFRALSISGFDRIQYERDSGLQTIPSSSRRARAAVEVVTGSRRHGYFDGIAVPGGSLVNLNVPSRPETSLTIDVKRPGSLVYFTFWASAGDTLRWSNVDVTAESETLPSGPSRTRFEVFASGPISVTLYPDSALLPGLVTPEPVPTDELDLTRLDRDANRARSSLMEAATLRFVRYPGLDSTSIAKFQILEMKGTGPLSLEESHFERRGNRPALRLKVRGEVERLRVTGGGYELVPSLLRRLQHDDLFWPIVTVVGGVLAIVFANVSWWEPEGTPGAADEAAPPAGAARAPGASEGAAPARESTPSSPAKQT